MSAVDDALERVVLVQTNEGTPREVGRTLAPRTIKIGRRWDVVLDGRVLGQIEYRMFTRECRVEGRRYVEARWESPGWGVVGTCWYEAYSKRAAVAYVVRAAVSS